MTGWLPKYLGVHLKARLGGSTLRMQYVLGEGSGWIRQTAKEIKEARVFGGREVA